MEKLNVSAHTSYIGNTGISNHFRSFLRSLSKHCNLKVRNFTVGSTWNGLSAKPHNNEPYINEIDKSILYRQTLVTNGVRTDHPIYTDYKGKFDVTLVSDIAEHYYFFEQYDGPKIGYFAWESTRIPSGFFEKLKEFDEVWVPSAWQKNCLCEQGYDESKIQIVHEGVEKNTFFPEEVSCDQYYSDGRFKFIMFGRWEYRKCTKEIIRTFLNTFNRDEPVDLILSVDNGWAKDGCKNTKERLLHNGFQDSRLIPIGFCSREDYIKFLKRGHVFLSCSRGEGWNLPLIEAMACGTPSIYSYCSAQLEYAIGKGLSVNTLKEIPSDTDEGTYREPDFGHLSKVMRDAYTNYKQHKKTAILNSTSIRENFCWEKAAEVAYEKICAVHNKHTQKKMKILYITPHLSTGGCPQFLLKKIKLLKDEHELHCIEYANYGGYTIQRKQIQELLKDRFYELNQNQNKIPELINKISPDVIHFEEMPEYFMDHAIAKVIYEKSRKYIIIETSHDSSFNPSSKVFFPDKILLVSEFQKENLKSLNIPMEVYEYPLAINLKKPRNVALKTLNLDPTKKHVVHVGLFTPRKNQAEIVEYAKRLKDYPIQFHFIGNQAPNFESYWGPIMKDFPSNCTWWNERKDVENFYQAADLFLFVSKEQIGDKETSPLVLREAASFNVPTLMYDLPVYMKMYDKYDNIKYLTGDMNHNCNKILEVLNIGGLTDITQKNEYKVVPGDVVVDLGAHGGDWSRSALAHGASEVYSFEPFPEYARSLRKDIPEAKIYQLAVSAKNETIEVAACKMVSITLLDVLNIVNKPIDYVHINIGNFATTLFDDLSYQECSNFKKISIRYDNAESLCNITNTLKAKGFLIDVTNEYVNATFTSVAGISVKYDNTSNKIIYSSPISIKNTLVSVREIDSKMVMWSAHHDPFEAGIEYWIIPVPKEWSDFEADPVFGGLTVDFYQGDKIIFSKDFRIKHPAVIKPRVKIKNNFSPCYNNYMEFFVHKIYEKYLSSKSFDVVVDVGANVGMWIEYARSVAYCNKIYAVEPNVQALKILNDSFTKDEITIVDKALCASDGELEFFVDQENSTISSIAKYGALKNSYKVKSISFKSFLKEYNINTIDLMKVDIETGEYDLFESLDQSDFNKINSMLVEYHLFNGRTYEKDATRLINMFKSAGFSTETSQQHSGGGFIFATKG
jgi:FkbM family methyltransferase